ncbi:hypothetical protein [Streptomyces griseoluteus]|uniref:hypothetical protein n=1 Tax=Streptomyces griseoluteus TaxID=29306 RepID=UPI0036F98711
MVLVPGWVWQGGPVRRALGAGLAAGVFFGLFVLVESGAWAAAVVVLLVLTPLHGVRVAQRMSRVWPAGAYLDPADRAAVVRATRSGGTVPDPRLAPDVLRYAEALRLTAERDRIRQWVMVLVAVVSLALAGYDTTAGTARQALVSWLVVVLVVLDLIWWPRRRDRLMDRVEHAEAAARAPERRSARGG